jgi:ribosomal-protein-alanine N-acetyltransferase
MTESKPRPFLESDRIRLREVRPSDADGRYYQWINDPEVTSFLESRFYPVSGESLQQYIADRQKDRDSIFLAIVDKKRDSHIGNVKLGPIDWIHRRAEIGILIGEKSLWGRGYATETIRLVVDYAFRTLGLHKVTAGCYANNLGSQRAFEKAGFGVEGTRRSHLLWEGQYVDLVLLGIVNE